MSDRVELKPTFIGPDGLVTTEGNEVLVRGIGGRMLGIGTFAGGLVLAEADETEIYHPVIEVQGKFVGGGQLDQWTTDSDLIYRHRYDEVYPIEAYLADIAVTDTKIASVVDRAYAEEFGVRLD